MPSPEERIEQLEQQIQSLADQVGEIIVYGLGFLPPTGSVEMMQWETFEEPGEKPISFWALTADAQRRLDEEKAASHA